MPTLLFDFIVLNMVQPIVPALARRDVSTDAPASSTSGRRSAKGSVSTRSVGTMGGISLLIHVHRRPRWPIYSHRGRVVLLN